MGGSGYVSHNAERDERMWRDYCRGKTQAVIAREHGLTQQAVSIILRAMAAEIGEAERAELVRTEVAHMRDIRVDILRVWDMPAPPVTQRVGEGWEYVHDPEHGNALVRDHSGRLAAVRAALAYTERMHRVLGLDAATQLDIGVSEEAAARLAAADALAHLHGRQGER